MTAEAGERHWPRLHAAATVLGVLASLAILLSVAISLVPLDNPGVQQCGAPAAYLLGGRINLYPDANDHIVRTGGRVQTLTKAEISRAYNHPCSRRVADRMVPVFVLFTAGSLVALLMFVVSCVVWWRRAAPDGPPAGSTPPVPGPTGAAEPG